jgi:small-conductance mechanosensitive channel
MSGGKFEGVVSGTWSTTSSGWWVKAVAAVAVVGALDGYLWTLLRFLAVLLTVVLVLFTALAVPAAVWMRRWTSRQHQQFNRQLAALPDEPRQAVKAAAPPVIQNFYGGTNVFMLPGSQLPAGISENSQVIRAYPLRDAVTDTTEGGPRHEN